MTKDSRFEETLDAMKRRAESKVNAELKKLRDEMDKSRCSNCGFTGYEHQEWCTRPRGKN